MSLTATGIDVTRNRDNTITVRASIFDSDTEQREVVPVTGRTLAECRELLQTVVQDRWEKGKDAALRTAVVGKVLASTGEK